MLRVVLWKITPKFAEWVSSPSNIFFQNGIVGDESTVLELGCGIAGVVAMAMAPKIRRYIATDQQYVFKALRHNLKENGLKPRATQPGTQKLSKHVPDSTSNIELLALDWETDFAVDLAGTVDMIVACDCIYNEALIGPFVRTCRELCDSSRRQRATFCVVAQQLRSHTVFEAWLAAFCKDFRVWRIPDNILGEGLRAAMGYVVHLGVLRYEDTEERREQKG